MKLFSAFIICLILSWSLLSAQCINDNYTGFGGQFSDKGQSIVADSMQNVYFSGVFTDSIQLGNFNLITDSIGQFLCKLSPTGNILWAKTLFSSFDNYFTYFPPVLRIGHSGQLVMAGTCQELNADFDTITNAFNNGDLFIARFDTASGSLNSFISTGRHIYAYIYDMDIDLNDNVYLAGSFVGSINFGGISMVCLGQTNSFLVKFNSQDQSQWARRITTSPNVTGNVAYSLDYDNYNHLFISGWFGLNANFGNGVALNSPVYSNGFLAKYDLSGNIEWAVPSDTNTAIYNQVVMDTSSIIVVQTPPARLLNFDQNGDTTWTKIISNNSYNLFSDFRKFNNQYFGLGTFYNSILIDGTTYTSSGSNIFICCFDLNGAIEWVRIIQTTNVTPASFAFDQQSDIYLTGEYGANNLINQNTVLPTWGNSEALFVKLCNGASTINDFPYADKNLHVFPNPANEVITINAVNCENISIINMIGEVVLQKNSNSKSEKNILCDIHDLSPGMYFVRVGTQIQKFIKQ